MEGETQQFASRKVEHRGCEFFEGVGQAVGSRYDVGDLEQQPISTVFGRSISPECEFAC